MISDRDLECWDAEDKDSQGEVRRKVFWEIVTLDGWMVSYRIPYRIDFDLLRLMSFRVWVSVDRPQSTSRKSTATGLLPRGAPWTPLILAVRWRPQLSVPLPIVTHSPTLVHDWHTWKHGFSRFIGRVLEKALGTNTPLYSEILELDRGIHAFSMPPDAEALVNGLPVPAPSPENTPGLTMQRGLFLQARGTSGFIIRS